MNNAISSQRIQATEGATTTRLRRRIVAVASTTGTLAATWLIATATTDTINGPGFGDQDPTEVGLPAVLVSGLLSTLIGWSLLAILERFTPQATRIWVTVAVAFSLLSLVGPLSGSGVDTSDRLVLVAMHIVAALVFIPMMWNSTRQT